MEFEAFCVCCLSEEERHKRRINMQIEEMIRQNKKDTRREMKLLLLGKSECHYLSTFIEFLYPICWLHVVVDTLL